MEMSKLRLQVVGRVEILLNCAPAQNINTLSVAKAAEAKMTNWESL